MSWRTEADRRARGQRPQAAPWRPCPACGNVWGLRPFFPLDLSSRERWRCVCGHRASTAEADASFLAHAVRTYPESQWERARERVGR